MIFVTVGTHEQPFNRLVKKIDDLKRDCVITEEVIIQTGFSTYEPIHCKFQDFFTYQQMMENIISARIVITHGGPSSFIQALQLGKIPIVVPRQYKFGEHINNHQLDFAMMVAKRKNNIFVVENIDKIESAISNYDKMFSAVGSKMKSNNQIFCNKLSIIVENLFKA